MIYNPWLNCNNLGTRFSYYTGESENHKELNTKKS